MTVSDAHRVSARDLIADFVARAGTQCLDQAAGALELASLPLLPAPIVLERASREAIASSSEALAALLARVLDVRLAHDVGVIAEHLSIPKDLAPFVDVERATDDARARLSCWRLDGLLDDATGALRFIEVQAGDPSGPGWTDLALRAWSDAGLTAALGAEPDLLASARVAALRARVPRDRKSVV